MEGIIQLLGKLLNDDVDSKTFYSIVFFDQNDLKDDISQKLNEIIKDINNDSSDLYSNDSNNLLYYFFNKEFEIIHNISKLIKNEKKLKEEFFEKILSILKSSLKYARNNTGSKSSLKLSYEIGSDFSFLTKDPFETDYYHPDEINKLTKVYEKIIRKNRNSTYSDVFYGKYTIAYSIYLLLYFVITKEHKSLSSLSDALLFNLVDRELTEFELKDELLINVQLIALSRVDIYKSQCFKTSDYINNDRRNLIKEWIVNTSEKDVLNSFRANLLKDEVHLDLNNIKEYIKFLRNFFDKKHLSKRFLFANRSSVGGTMSTDENRHLRLLESYNRIKPTEELENTNNSVVYYSNDTICSFKKFVDNIYMQLKNADDNAIINLFYRLVYNSFYLIFVRENYKEVKYLLKKMNDSNTYINDAVIPYGSLSVPGYSKILDLAIMKKNVFALYDLADGYYYGTNCQKESLYKAFHYYKLCAGLDDLKLYIPNGDHNKIIDKIICNPLALWSLAFILFNYRNRSTLKYCDYIRELENISKKDRYELAIMFAKRSIELDDSAAGYNTLGIILGDEYYQKNKNSFDNKINDSLGNSDSYDVFKGADYYFEKAANKEYLFGYNNLYYLYSKKLGILRDNVLSNSDEYADTLVLCITYLEKSASMLYPYANNKLARIISENKEIIFSSNLFNEKINEMMCKYKVDTINDLIKLFYYNSVIYKLDQVSPWAAFNLLNEYDHSKDRNLLISFKKDYKGDFFDQLRCFCNYPKDENINDLEDSQSFYESVERKLVEIIFESKNQQVINKLIELSARDNSQLNQKITSLVNEYSAIYPSSQKEVINEMNSIIFDGYTDSINVAISHNNGSLFHLGNVSGQKYKADDQTLYDLASITKLFTAIAVFKLIDKGYINLNTKIKKIAKENHFQYISDATIGNLLDYTAFQTDGYIENYESNIALEMIYNIKYPDFESEELQAILGEENLDDNRLQEYLNKHRKYNDMGCIVLSLLLNDYFEQNQNIEIDFGDEHEKFECTSYKEYIKLILKRIGMTNTFWWDDINDSININSYTNSYRTRYSDGKKIIECIERAIGEVHDPKAKVLNTSIGSAGLFSCSQDMKILMDAIFKGDVFSEETITLFKNHCDEELSDHRFFKYLASVTNIKNKTESVIPYRLSRNSIAFQGYTGNLILIDFERKIGICILANRVYNRNTDEYCLDNESTVFGTKNFPYRRDVLIEKILNFIGD